MLDIRLQHPSFIITEENKIFNKKHCWEERAEMGTADIQETLWWNGKDYYFFLWFEFDWVLRNNLHTQKKRAKHNIAHLFGCSSCQ